MEMVKELRAKTGAGILNCQKALKENDGDMESAVDFLRKKGLAAAAKRAGRSTNEGYVVTNYSEDDKEVFSISVMCETDFVSKTDDFKELAKDIAREIESKLGETQKEQAISQEVADEFKDRIAEIVIKVGENTQIGDYAKFISKGDSYFYNYTHFNNKIGVIIELDAPKKDETLDKLGKNICLHIAAMGPKFVDSTSIPQLSLIHI